MTFKVMVSADIFEVKDNITFEFPARPSMLELATACEAVYDVEMRSKRRRDTPDVAFKVQQFQFFDEVLCQWSELYNQLQLSNCCQVFAFQPTSALHSDREGAVPAPREYVTWVPSEQLERRVVPALTDAKRVEWVYGKLAADGGVPFWTLKNIFTKAGMNFTTNPVTDYFDAFDRDQDGKLNKQEFGLFHESNPGVITALYFRLNDVSDEHPTVMEALDDAIEQERMAIRCYQRKEKEEKAKRQQAAIQRLASGKSSMVTSSEVRRREAWLSQLAEEKKAKEDEEKRILRKIEEEKEANAAGVLAGLTTDMGVNLNGGSCSPRYRDASGNGCAVAGGPPVVGSGPPTPMPPLSSLPGMPRPPHPKSPTLKKAVSRPVLPTTPRRTSTSSTASRHTPQALGSLKRGYSFAPPGTTPATPSTPGKRSLESPVRSI
eukprot:TRINITY_DN40039_c0_g1_i1.p1 TRINITY_DN40039_c0_g1~~TRINITY_DN40039_c0_g1_i1.p1  ORF type:complete len:434 (+),score=86.73 TRINITY_DN40039_c0_g1_i1:61-1362(+)